MIAARRLLYEYSQTADIVRPRTGWICMSSYRQNDQFCMHRDARRPFAACTNIPVESSGVSEPLIGSSYARDAGWSSSVVQRHCCRDLVVGNWSGKGLTALRPFRTRSSSPSALHGRVGLSRLCVGGKASYQWSGRRRTSVLRASSSAFEYLPGRPDGYSAARCGEGQSDDFGGQPRTQMRKQSRHHDEAG